MGKKSKSRKSTDTAHELQPSSVLGKHAARVWGVALTPDGKKVISGSRDKTLKVWDIETGAEIRTLEGHTGPVNAVAVTDDGKKAISASGDRTLKVWDIETGAEIRTLRGHTNGVFAVAVTEDGKKAISASSDSTLKVWDIENGKEIRTLEGHTDPVIAVAVTEDGTEAISASYDHTLKVWDIETGKEIRTLKGHTDYVLAVAVTGDGKKAISASKDKTLKVWDLETGAEIRILKGHTNWVRAVAVTEDGKKAISASDDQTVRLWHLDTGSCIAILEGHTAGVNKVAVTPDGQRAVSGADDKTVRIWDLPPIGEEPVRDAETSYYTNAKVVLVGESSTGKTCLARALMGLPFEPQESTHGMKIWNFQSETTKPDEGGQVTRETLLWDLAGQVDYQVVHQLFLDQTALGIVMFDSSHPEEPFKGVGHWEKALARVSGDDCPRLLVAGRVDRGHPTATPEDIEAFRVRHGYQQFIATSANTGEGLDEVQEAIGLAIPWERLPVTSSPKLWELIREYLLKRRAGEEVLSRRADLREAFRQEHPDAEFTDAEFDTVIGHAQAQGLIWRFSFGDFVLMKPELLNDYAAAIVRAARRHPQGLGCVLEQDVLDAAIDFEDLKRLKDAETERSLLHAVVQLFLERDLALRESGHLVFPSKFNRQLPDAPEPPKREVAYSFAGLVEEVYATLVARLFYCGAFALEALWKNAGEFLDSLDNLCGFTLDSSVEGEGAISIFFGENTPDNSKVLFLRFIHEHLHQRSIDKSVQRQRIYRCPECTEEVENRRAIEVRLRKGISTISCQFCDSSIELVDALEAKFASPELLIQIRSIEEEVAEKKSQAVGEIVARAKESVREYDVFLAHNSADKKAVIAIYKALRGRGLNPWLDKKQVPPGQWFQDIIQQAIQDVKSAAIFIGKKGLGRWQLVELRSFISQCVEREIPVIPVLLPGVKAIPKKLLFLEEFSLVKFEKSIDEPDALDSLEWGITGERPKGMRD